MNAWATPDVGAAVGDPSNQLLVWATVVVLVVIAVVAVVAAIWVARVTRSTSDDEGSPVDGKSGPADLDDGEQNLV